ncbi:MAG: amidohydrolase family protein [Chloroflexi bacterium]|nr:amidohydrolase family protein [Chloroflexota bacterium]
MTVDEPPAYIKDAPPRVFDTHVHYPWRPSDAGGPLSGDGIIEALVYNCQRLNIRRVCLLGRRGEVNDRVLRAHERYPSLVVPMANVDPDQDGPDEIGELAERGFRGLKISNTRRNYDHPAYFRMYAEAEQRGLVILFHTGISGGPIDYLQYPPASPEQARAVASRFEEMRRFKPEAGEVDSWYGAGRMQPIYLDSVSLAFPDLRIIGAHLGYGLYDSAAAVARWRRNVYFDVSGGTVVRRHIVDRRMSRTEVAVSKLTWGSDSDVAHMSRELSSWMAAFVELGLTEQEQDAIFWGNAAQLFGIDE